MKTFPMMIVTIVFLSFLYHTSAEVSSNRTTLNDFDIMLRRLDNRVRPMEDGDPITVYCNIYVVSFGSINMVDMEYTLNLYLRQTWDDPRLAYNTTDKDRPLVLDARTMENVWKPDIFFPMEKKANFHDMTVPNRMMRVFHNGTVMYSLRLTMTIACPMNLFKFPMDTQRCEFMLESYSYSSDDLLLRWTGDYGVEVDLNLELPQFDLTSVDKTNECVRTYKTGTFECLRASFHLHRQFGFYLLQTFVPSILIVILSWVSFWLPAEAVPARISLGVTTVLTMVTQLSGSRNNAPKVSYPKALDIWMATCMVFVFLALLEYAFVNVLARETKTGKKSSNGAVADGGPGSEEIMAEDGSMVNSAPMKLLEKFHEKRQRISMMIADEEAAKQVKKKLTGATLMDESAKVLFPLVFILLNIFYWVFYLVVEI